MKKHNPRKSARRPSTSPGRLAEKRTREKAKEHAQVLMRRRMKSIDHALLRFPVILDLSRAFSADEVEPAFDGMDTRDLEPIEQVWHEIEEKIRELLENEFIIYDIDMDVNAVETIHIEPRRKVASQKVGKSEFVKVLKKRPKEKGPKN